MFFFILLHPFKSVFVKKLLCCFFINKEAQVTDMYYFTTLFAAAQGGRKEIAISEYFCVHFSMNMV